jgi:RNA polymerase sigma-70 factor (ECF subfamily)
MSEKLTWLERIQKESKEKRERAPIVKLARRKLMKSLAKKKKGEKKALLRAEKIVMANRAPTPEVEKKPMPQKPEVKVSKKKEPVCLSDMILSFQQGGEKGFTHFFNLFYPPLLYYASGLVSDEEIAKDSISEAFVKAWERKEMFVNERHLKVWIYTVTRNLCYSKWKYYNKNHSDIFEMDEIEAGERIDHLLIKAEVYDQLYRRINNLPPQCRKILCLLYFEKKTTNEICAELNLAKTTVKNQKARGLATLRKRYGVTEEQFHSNEVKKVRNILKSEASNRSIGNRYGLSGGNISSIRINGIKNVGMMRKIV